MILAIWREVCPDLNEEQRLQFAALACNGLDGYIDAFTTACKDIKDKSVATKIKGWLEPIYNVANAVQPVLSVAANGAGIPLPIDVVMGGLHAVLGFTSKIPNLQERAIKLLTRMGDKARTLENFSWILSSDDVFIKRALLTIYADIATFCLEAVAFFDTRGSLRNRFKEKVKALFLDEFSTKLTVYALKFENHFEDLRDAALSLQGRTSLKIEERQAALQAEFQNVLESTTQFGFRQINYLEEQHDTKERRRAEKERRELRELFNSAASWISKLDFQTEFRRRCNDHLEGTGQWFLNAPRYLDWKANNESDVLWVRGSPGCGKSILSMLAITDLQSDPDPNVGVTYALCSRDKQQEQSLVSIIGSMIGQLLRQRNELTRNVRDEYLRSKSGEVLDNQRVLNMLNSTTDIFSTVYLVIDALDEFRDSRDLLTNLLSALDQTQFRRKLKILVLSRRESIIQDIFEKRKCAPIQPETENEVDIKTYIEFCLPESAFSEVRTLCLKKASGMFMWVRLILQATDVRLATKQSILELLNTLPPGLDPIYDIIFDRLSCQTFHKKAWLVLHWMLKTHRPLREKELLDAVGGYTDITSVKDIDRHKSGDILVELCKDLIRIDLHNNFCFIHDSVRLYLLNQETTNKSLQLFQKEHQKAHDILASICLKYLALEDFDERIPASRPAMEILVRKYDLLQYAAVCWGWHVAEGNSDQHLTEIEALIDSVTRRELCIQLLLLARSHHRSWWHYPDSTSAFHLLAFLNLTSITTQLLDASSISDLGTDGNNKDPLAYAIYFGYEDMAILLMKRIQAYERTKLQPSDLKAILEASTRSGWLKMLAELQEIDATLIDAPLRDGKSTALAIACGIGNEQVATKLVKDLGADPNLEGINGSTPLGLAAETDMTKIVLLLLSHGAVADKASNDGRTPLYYAASRGNPKAADALLKRGASPYTKGDPDGQSPLHQAASLNAVSVLHAMKKHHPDLNLGGLTKSQQTPLHFAAWNNADKFAKALIHLGCPKDVQDVVGRSALHIAAYLGAAQTVAILLESNCSTTLVDTLGNTALHLAANHPHYETVNIILASAGIEAKAMMLKARDDRGDSALHLACIAGCERTVQKLLDEGFDPSSPGNRGFSSLHHAASCGHSHLIWMLLSKIRDVNLLFPAKVTPLHMAAALGHVDFVNQFVSACSKLGLSIDYAAKDKNNRTALYVAACRTNHMMTRTLLSLTPSSSYNLKDSIGLNMIHRAALSGDLALVEFLVDNNHDSPLIPADNGTTSLHFAVDSNEFEIFEYLLPRSIPCLESVDEAGRTVLMLALRNKQIEMANRVLQVKEDLDLSIIDAEGSGAMHYAAVASNFELFKRLLDMGCRSFAPNKSGITPFHLAIKHGSLSMVQLLMERGFDDIYSCDSYGRYADFFATETGRIEMLQFLCSLDLPLGRSDHTGWNAAHVAAELGHTDILEYLGKNGVDVHKPNEDNVTPFLLAAQNGYPLTMLHLLEDRSDCLFDSIAWSGETALISTAHLRYDVAFNLLIEAGSLLDQHDAFGNTPLETRNGVIGAPQEKYLDRDHREKLQLDAIQNCLQRCSGHGRVTTPVEGQRLTRYFTDLGRALRIHGDLELSKLCNLPQSFESSLSPFYSPPYCEGCYLVLCQRTTFICKSCLVDFYLCKKCHEEYRDADRRMPPALIPWLEMEERVRNVRLICSQVSDIGLIALSMACFRVNAGFLQTMSARYKHWEETHEPKGRYLRRPRPGQEWLRLIHEYLDHESTDSEELLYDIQLCYEEFDRLNRPEKECTFFRCQDHEFMQLTLKEYEDLKRNGQYYDAQTGQHSQALLQRIRDELSLLEESPSPPVGNEASEVMQITPTKSPPSLARRWTEPKQGLGSMVTLDRRLTDLSNLKISTRDRLSSDAQKVLDRNTLPMAERPPVQNNSAFKAKTPLTKGNDKATKKPGALSTDGFLISDPEQDQTKSDKEIETDTKTIRRSSSANLNSNISSTTPAKGLSIDDKVALAAKDFLDIRNAKASRNNQDGDDSAPEWKFKQILDASDSDYEKVIIILGLEIADEIEPGAREFYILNRYAALESARREAEQNT